MSDWNFSDGFPSIDIDVEYWTKLSLEEKGRYLMRMLFQEKDMGSRINLMNYICSTGAKVGRSFVKNPEAKAYFDVLENATNLISVSAAVGNIFKAKQKFKNTKNNEIAKLMGFPNGDYVDEMRLDITHAMAEAFIEMSDYHKEKYGITVDNIVSDSKDGKKGEESEDTSSIVKNYKMAGTVGEETKWGLTIKTTGGIFEDEDTTSSTACRLFHAVSGMKLHPDELRDEIQQIMYELYIEKVDTRKNFVMINGTKLEVCERVEIKENITNVDINKISRAITKILDEESRRGVVFVGEPGVGKTISVHKIVNKFKDRLVFWVSADSINSTMGIRNVFKIFKMFKNSIVVFDDLDAAPFTSKDEITTEFLKHLDGKNNKDLTGFYIATVNDPSKIHMTVINRPERFDDVVLVKNPSKHSEVTSIIFSKARERGYYPENEYDENEWEAKGKITFDIDCDELKEITNQIIEAEFTQVQVSGLVSDCHTYTEDDTINLELLRDAVQSRLDSIDTSSMVATKGKLKIDKERVSEEALASMGKKRY